MNDLTKLEAKNCKIAKKTLLSQNLFLDIAWIYILTAWLDLCKTQTDLSQNLKVIFLPPLSDIRPCRYRVHFHVVIVIF